MGKTDLWGNCRLTFRCRALSSFADSLDEFEHGRTSSCSHAVFLLLSGMQPKGAKYCQELEYAVSQHLPRLYVALISG